MGADELVRRCAVRPPRAADPPGLHGTTRPQRSLLPPVLTQSVPAREGQVAQGHVHSGVSVSTDESLRAQPVPCSAAHRRQKRAFLLSNGISHFSLCAHGLLSPGSTAQSPASPLCPPTALRPPARLPRAVLESPALGGWTGGHEVLRTGGSAGGGEWLDSLVLRGFSNQNNSVLL